MSNSLLRAAHRVSGLPAMARQVLVVLADEARDARGGRSSLTTAQISDRTGLSRRTIHRAYVILIEAGHITREETAPGAALATVVHPRLANLPAANLAEGADTLADPLCQPVRGVISYRDRPDTSSPLASAREADFEGFKGPAPQPVPAPAPAAPVPPPAPATRELEPVDQVFDAWDGWRDRAGLPGPVTRNAGRRVAVARAIEANGLGKVLMMVDTVERGVRAGQFRRKHAERQDSIWATFDAAFEVGHAAGLNLLARLLDGEFGAVVPAAATPAVKECLTVAEAGDPDQRLRAAMGKRIGAAAARQWIDPLVFDWRGDELRAVAPTAFHADWVTEHFAGHLRGAAGGVAVRVVMREKV